MPRRNRRVRAAPPQPAAPPAPAAPAPAAPAPYRPRPLFETFESEAYEVSQDLLSGDAAIDAVNHNLAEIYTEIAGYRKEIYEAKVSRSVKDPVSHQRYLKATRTLVTQLKKDAEELRKGLPPGKAFEEPIAFKIDM